MQFLTAATSLMINCPREALLKGLCHEDFAVLGQLILC